MPRRSAFTLVELMIVVAIIAVLAAIAVPQMQQQQLMTKRSEAGLNLQGLLDAAVAYQTALDSWGFNSGWQPGPGGVPYSDKKAHPWDDGTIPNMYSYLDWAPDGDVRCGYYYTTDDATYVYARAQCDIDDNGDNYERRDAVDPTTHMRDLLNIENCLVSGVVPPAICY